MIAERHTPDRISACQAAAIRGLLRGESAINLMRLSNELGVDSAAIVGSIESLIEAGLVEVLNPVGHEDCIGSGRYDVLNTFFKWKRPGDALFAWQMGMHESVKTSQRRTMNKISMLALVGAIGLAAVSARAEETIVMDGSTTVGPIAKAFAEYYMKNNPGVNITVGESGSGNGAKSLINSTCNIADMSRAIKDTEVEAAQAKKVNPVDHIIAMDGLSVIVHPGNPVKGLSKEELKQIFTGEISNWKQLGGPDQKIVVISRDTNSGTYETWETLVMKADRITDKAEYVGSNGAVRQRVMSTPNAIGYVGLAFIEGVKALPVNDIAPTPETVLDKSYPISRPLHMYTNGEPDAGSNVGKLVNLYKTPEGRKIIEETGFVPLKN